MHMYSCLPEVLFNTVPSLKSKIQSLSILVLSHKCLCVVCMHMSMHMYTESHKLLIKNN